MNKLEKIKKKALEDSSEELEDLIREHLPEDASVHDLTIEHDTYIRGASTVLLNGDPLISVFPLDIEHIEEEGSLKIKLSRNYYDHRKEEEEEDEKN